MGASRRSTLPPVVRIPCPLWNKSLNRCELEPVAFLLPHLILSSIPAGKEAEFCEVPGDRQDLAQELREWGARTNVDVESLSVAACGLWGDGAPYDRNDSLQLLIMSIFTGTEGEQMYWLCGIGKNRLCRCGCSGRHTLEPILRILVWSFSAAAAGVHPRYDHSGNLLAAGTTLGDLASQEFAVRGAMISKRGDWAWHKAVLGMYGWKGEGPNKRICWLCRAGMDPSCTAFDFSSSATWGGSRVTQIGILGGLSKTRRFYQLHMEYAWLRAGIYQDGLDARFVSWCCSVLLCRCDVGAFYFVWRYSYEAPGSLLQTSDHDECHGAQPRCSATILGSNH